jgi:uncharacterized protein YdaU (DUF1376 family)
MAQRKYELKTSIRKMKDPAFLFYPADFLIGCADLTSEEIGFYIKLLCYQHQKGHLSKKSIGFYLGYGLGFEWVSLSAEFRSKFKEDEEGLIFNRRLEREITERSQFIEKQRNNGKMGGRPKTQTKPKQNPNINPNINPNETQTKASRDEDININEDENINENNKGGMGEKEETPNVENHCTEGDETFCEVLEELSFENVWTMYGKKGNKKTSQQKWGKLKNHCKLSALKHIPEYVKATLDIQYRKNFETYINQEVWNDEIIKKNGNRITENGGTMGRGNTANGANTFRTDAEKRRDERQVFAKMAESILQQP